jgi:hypothetical protein
MGRSDKHAKDVRSVPALGQRGFTALYLNGELTLVHSDRDGCQDCKRDRSRAKERTAAVPTVAQPQAVIRAMATRATSAGVNSVCAEP